MKIVFLIILFVMLFPSIASAEEPFMVVRGLEEARGMSDTPKVGVMRIIPEAETSALDPDGIISLIMLTPETAAERWGKPGNLRNAQGGHVLEWKNGYSLEFDKSEKLKRITYKTPADMDLPFEAPVVRNWGFAPGRPDDEHEGLMRWKGKLVVKELLILRDGKKNRLRMMQVLINNKYI